MLPPAMPQQAMCCPGLYDVLGSCWLTCKIRSESLHSGVPTQLAFPRQLMPRAVAAVYKNGRTARNCILDNLLKDNSANTSTVNLTWIEVEQECSKSYDVCFWLLAVAIERCRDVKCVLSCVDEVRFIIAAKVHLYRFRKLLIHAFLDIEPVWLNSTWTSSPKLSRL